MILKDLHDPNKMQGQTLESAAFSYRNGKLSEKIEKIEVVSEHRVEVYVNEQLTARLVCTPSDIAELVIGRLATENIIQSVDEIRELYICESGNRAKVFLKDSTKRFSPFVEQAPTCCSDNHVYLKTADSKEQAPLTIAEWDAEQILQIAADVNNGAKLYRSTHGTHGGFLIHNGTIVYQCEDIGRHNAVDKAIGHMLLCGIVPEECMLYSTGRASEDMIRKTIRAGIPVFLSKAAPTGAAVEMANAYCLTLICNLRTDRFEWYSKMIEEE